MRQSSRSSEPSAPHIAGHLAGRIPGRRRALVGALAAALALGAVAAAPTGSSSAAPVAAAAAAPVAASAAALRSGNTSFQVASFNALGHSHTKPGGDRKGWESGPKRMRYATQLLEETGVDLVGFQEFEPQQYAAFTKLMGATWSIAPGLDASGYAQSKAIAWRTADWTLVSQTTFMSPYFGGQMQARPLIQLRNNATGQLIWVLNTHNPANTRGDAQKWRDQGERIQAALINNLRRQNPQIPVIFVGDMNDRERFYCPMTYLTELESASGGYHEDVPGGACLPAKPMKVDWIMGTPDIFWSGYTSLEQGLIKKTSDHALIYATATIPPDAAAKAGIKRVVVIDVEGLRSPVISARRTPTLAWLRSKGASTLSARTLEERTTSLPNTVSMVTGRPVRRKDGGHGIATASTRGNATVHGAAGRYVASMFDVAHDVGMTTGFYSGDARSGLLVRSWNAKYGAADRIGRNNGRDKINRSYVGDRDNAAFRAARKQLAKSAPTLTFVQFDDAARAAEKYGPRSRKYLAALRLADARVKRIVKTISSNSRTAGSTMVIVTASGTGPSPTSSRVVPFLVWGPGVARAADLYALNPTYTTATARRSKYSGRQPIRSAAVANLVTSVLRLPVVDGSGINSKQDLDVFDPALTAPPRSSVPRS
ncbi:alkaline phosphatase family protein [Nocardioides sp. W7]|uniref:alkaline phosphatase family protein n=1 Tax=Nocardioides sp. W7 TaxID=2931390 RepID=UPI001FD5B396|nr:alkaline phosphatase family protein [Nocardioides sp. W7]